MTALDIKLLRDVRRLWAQVLAIALVVGGGVATLVLAVGSHRSLEETRIAYYERYGFADVFAQVKRAPKALADRIARDSRRRRPSTRASPSWRCSTFPASPSRPADSSFRCPTTASRISIGSICAPAGFRSRDGRRRSSSTSLSHAPTASPRARGSQAILNGKKRELIIVGTALSPEFVYTVGPGDLMPDDRRYGIVWMSEKALAGVYDLDGAFSCGLGQAAARRFGARGHLAARRFAGPLWRAGGPRPEGPDLARLARS